MKRHMTFSRKNTKLIPSSPSNYTFTEKQHEVEDSPPISEGEIEYKNEATPPKEEEDKLGFDAFTPYADQASEEEEIEEQLEYITNPNTSVTADITSHIRNAAEEYGEKNSANIQYMLRTHGQVKQTQEIEAKIRKQRKYLQRKYVEEGGQVYQKVKRGVDVKMQNRYNKTRPNS